MSEKDLAEIPTLYKQLEFIDENGKSEHSIFLYNKGGEKRWIKSDTRSLGTWIQIGDKIYLNKERGD